MVSELHFFQVVVFYFLQMTQHIYAHPQRDHSKERSAERVTNLENLNRLNIPLNHKITNTRRRGMLAGENF